MDQYTVKINRRDNALEVSGDKDWVEAKLQQFAEIYAEPATHETLANNLGRRGRSTPKRAGKKAAGADGETKSARRRPGRPQKDAGLAAKLTSDLKQKVHEYRDARSVAFNKKAPNAMAIIAGALLDELEITEVGDDQIYTVYSVMGWPAPNITKAMENAHARDHYLSGLTDGQRELTQAGETFARHGSVNAA